MHSARGGFTDQQPRLCEGSKTQEAVVFIGLEVLEATDTEHKEPHPEIRLYPVSQDKEQCCMGWGGDRKRGWGHCRRLLRKGIHPQSLPGP